MKNKNDEFMDFLDELIGEPPTAGEIIRAFRANWGVTLKELEGMTGIKDNNLSDMENEKKPIGLKSAMKIGTALGIMPQTLLFPNDLYLKDKEILEVKKKSQEFWKRKVAA